MSIKFVIVNNFHDIYAGRDRTNRQGRLLPGDGIIAYSLSCERNKGEGGPADGNCKVDVDRMPVSVDRQADICCHFYVLVGRSASFVRIHSVATASCYSDRIEPVFELLATIGRFGPAFLYGEKVKAYLHAGARQLPGYDIWPNDQVGWGALCVSESLPEK